MFGELHHNLWWCKPLCQLPKCQEPFNVSALAPYVELEATSRVQLRAPGITSLSQNLLRTIKGKLTAPWNYFEPKFAIYSQKFFSLFHTPLWALAKSVSIFIYFQKSGPTTSSICIRINVWFSSIGSGLREILLQRRRTINFQFRHKKY